MYNLPKGDFNVKKILTLLLVFLVLSGCSKNKTEEIQTKPVADPNYIYEPWKENYDKNNDYIGDLIFESDLINVPVVQGESNETYLRTDWATMTYDEEGSIFMDYEVDLDSKNITIYGHYVYPMYDETRTHKFTPLHQLTEEDNYEKNKKISLYLENEKRNYIITNVLFLDLQKIGDSYFVNEDLHYYEPNMSEEYFDKYMKKINEISLYDTGEKIEYKDRFITLQTCVENRPDQRLIVIAKELVK